MEEKVTVLPDQAEESLYSDVCQIIDGTRGRIATFLNTEVCMTNWYIGKRIKEDVLFNQRAEYGKQVIKNLSLRLIGRYGSGWSEEKLRHCIRSAETFSEQDIVSSTQRQLTWTHLKSLMYIKDPLDDKADDKRTIKADDKRTIIIEYIHRNGEVKTEDLVKLLSSSTTRIKMLLYQLVDEGIFLQVSYVINVVGVQKIVTCDVAKVLLIVMKSGIHSTVTSSFSLFFLHVRKILRNFAVT